MTKLATSLPLVTFDLFFSLSKKKEKKSAAATTNNKQQPQIRRNRACKRDQT